MQVNEIRNCRFRFKCPNEWELLSLTDQEDQRYCNECQRTVYFCKTGKALMAAIQADQCVAVKTMARIEVGIPLSPFEI